MQIIRQSSHHASTVTSLSDALVLVVILIAHTHICFYGCTEIAPEIMGAVCILASPLVSFLQQVMPVTPSLVFVRNDGQFFLTRA